MISAQIVLDSISPRGDRLVTLEAVYPRWMHSQLMTHRAFSRNAQSSRAVPIDAMHVQSLYTPRFTAAKKLKGMANGEPVDDDLQAELEERWHCAEFAVKVQVRWMQDLAEQQGLELCRGQLNRLLEPFRYQKTIITALDDDRGWKNFRRLRLPGRGVQTETGELARAICGALDASEPTERREHVPYGPGLRRSVVTCARVSFLLDSEELSDRGVARRFKKLLASRHWSPFEHQAFACESGEVHPELAGNFWGASWLQLRKALDLETSDLKPGDFPLIAADFPAVVRDLARAASEGGES